MSKQMTYIVFLAIICCTSLLFSGCEQHDMAALKLHGNSGVWEMELYQETEYDPNGQILSQEVFEHPGQFVFFSSDGIDALSGFRQGLFIVYAEPNDVAFGLTWWTNGSAFIIRQYGGPLELTRTYTVKKDGGKEQVWEWLQLHDPALNPSFSIKNRVLITIREIKV